MDFENFENFENFEYFQNFDNEMLMGSMEEYNPFFYEEEEEDKDSGCEFFNNENNENNLEKKYISLAPPENVYPNHITPIVDFFPNTFPTNQLSYKKVIDYIPNPPGVCFNEELFDILIASFFQHFPNCKTLIIKNIYRSKKKFCFGTPFKKKENDKKVEFTKEDFKFMEFHKLLLDNGYLEYRFLNYKTFYNFLKLVYFKKVRFEIPRFIIQIIPNKGENLSERGIYSKINRIKRIKNKKVIYILNLYYNNKTDLSVLCALKHFKVLSCISYHFEKSSSSSSSSSPSKKSKKVRTRWKLFKGINKEILKNDIIFVFLKLL
jgi:hypothetical protein